MLVLVLIYVLNTIYMLEKPMTSRWHCLEMHSGSDLFFSIQRLVFSATKIHFPYDICQKTTSTILAKGRTVTSWDSNRLDLVQQWLV